VPAFPVTATVEVNSKRYTLLNRQDAELITDLEGHVMEITARGRIGTRQTLIKIFGDPAEIRTRCLADKVIQRYCYARLPPSFCA